MATTELNWREPEDWPRYRTSCVVARPLSRRLARELWFSVCCFGVIMLPWLLLRHYHLRNMAATPYWWMAFLLTLWITVRHWLSATHPVLARKIVFSEKSGCQYIGRQAFVWKYREFLGWAVIERQVEGRALLILLLKVRRRVIPLALPDAGTRDQIVRLLQEKRVPPAPDLTPPWESGRPASAKN